MTRVYYIIRNDHGPRPRWLTEAGEWSWYRENAGHFCEWLAPDSKMPPVVPVGGKLIRVTETTTEEIVT